MNAIQDERLMRQPAVFKPNRESGAVALAAADIHSLLVCRWAVVLLELGISESYLRDKHGPCPMCGGRDRFRFDDRWKRGNWICTQCGSGDGFELIMKVRGWSFAQARREVLHTAGIVDSKHSTASTAKSLAIRMTVESRSAPSKYALRVRDGASDIDRCAPVVQYLERRKLWPLPPNHALHAHPSFRYWDRASGRVVGYYPSLVGEVRDIAGELATVSVTFVDDGQKLSGYPARKLLSRITGRQGCAIRILPATGSVLGIAEGIETAVAAHKLFEIPVWAAWSASLLAKFEPPADVNHLVVFADNDDAGLGAARKLADRQRDRRGVEIRTPPRVGSDWADVLLGGGDSAAATVARVL